MAPSQQPTISDTLATLQRDIKTIKDFLLGSLEGQRGLLPECAARRIEMDTLQRELIQLKASVKKLEDEKLVRYGMTMGASAVVICIWEGAKYFIK